MRWTLTELCRSSWDPAHETDRQTYLRGCTWSPDGTCCLVVVNGGGVHVVELPKDLYANESVADRTSVDVLESVIQIPEAGLVYDIRWYPGMNSTIPETCCWITTRRHAPIQMWDAFDGSLRCSYRGYDSADELEPAISLCFSSDASQILGGYKKYINIFQTDRPGRDFTRVRLKHSASCLAPSPCHHSIAIGSWTTEINVMHLEDKSFTRLGESEGHRGGVTHLKYSQDGQYLISGARKDNALAIWDLRSIEKPLKVLNRNVATNQRIYFDISPCGEYLLSGNTDGSMKVWNLPEEIKECGEGQVQCYKMHNDCCNGVSMHPFRPIIATSSGQHHLNELAEGENEPILGAESISETSSISDVLDYKKSYENCLEFWWIDNM